MSRKTEKLAKTFEEDLKRLEEIINSLENGVPIEESLDYYQEGMILSGRLEARLSEIERKVFEVKNIGAIARGEDSELKTELFE